MALNKSEFLLFLTVCFVFCSVRLVAREKNGKEVPEGIAVTVPTGVSLFLTEVYRDFSGTVNEFDYLPGPSSGVEVSKFLGPALEAGIGITYSVLKGDTDMPDFSAAGIDPALKDLLAEPVQFSNRLYGPQVFARYHIGLKPDDPDVLSVFLKLGTGVLINESELYYTRGTGDEIIFGKGSGDDKSSSLANGVYSFGSGLSCALTERVHLRLAAGLNLVGYDLLDVVHNYDAAGNRMEVLGLYTDITAGIAVRLSGGAGKTSSGKGKPGGGHLPFAP